MSMAKGLAGQDRHLMATAAVRTMAPEKAGDQVC
jgi:hypothetical protein